MIVRKLQRRAVQALRGPARNFSAPRADQLRHASDAAYWMTRAFYVFALFVAFQTLMRLEGIGRSGDTISALWPVFWVPGVGLQLSAKLIGLTLVASALAAVAVPTLRLPRIVYAVALLMAVALRNSFGSISHADYFALWVSLFMVFAPTRRLARGASPSVHYFYTLPFFAAQVFAGLFYTLSGIFKVHGGIFVKEGNVSSFAPEALPILIMGRWLESGTPPLREGYFADNVWLAWPVYLAVIYIELVFLVAVFRPQLHRLFGVTIAAFHIGVYLTMGIIFPYQSALVCLLFACSPFTSETTSIRQTAFQLPGVGWLLRPRGFGTAKQRASAHEGGIPANIRSRPNPKPSPFARVRPSRSASRS